MSSSFMRSFLKASVPLAPGHIPSSWLYTGDGVRNKPHHDLAPISFAFFALVTTGPRLHRSIPKSFRGYGSVLIKSRFQLCEAFTAYVAAWMLIRIEHLDLALASRMGTGYDLILKRPESIAASAFVWLSNAPDPVRHARYIFVREFSAV